MKHTLEYYQDETRFLQDWSQGRQVYCLEDHCDRPFFIPTAKEISISGGWWCPEHITQKRLDKMIKKGF